MNQTSAQPKGDTSFWPLFGGFALWFLACCFIMSLYYWGCGKISVEIASKIIKIVSLLGIFYRLLEWQHETKNDAVGHEDQLRWAKRVFGITMLVMFILVFMVGNEAFESYHGIAVISAPKHTALEKITEILPVVGVGFISIMPIAALAWVNRKLSRTVDAVNATKFLYFVNYPCLASSFAVFALAILGVIAMPVGDMKNFLSGAMAFLVFVAFVTDSAIASGIDKKKNA